MITETEKKVLGLLSLAKKAGRLKSGEQGVLSSIQAGEVKLLLIAGDASANSMKRMQDKCRSHGVSWRMFSTMDQLGQATGASERAGVAVTDIGFAQAITDRIDRDRGVDSAG